LNVHSRERGNKEIPQRGGEEKSHRKWRDAALVWRVTEFRGRRRSIFPDLEARKKKRELTAGREIRSVEMVARPVGWEELGGSKAERGFTCAAQEPEEGGKKGFSRGDSPVSWAEAGDPMSRGVEKKIKRNGKRRHKFGADTVGDLLRADQQKRASGKKKTWTPISRHQKGQKRAQADL